MVEPLGYLLTWTCYGTWLHGNDRGSVDRDHNRVGASYLPLDEKRLEREESRLANQMMVLDDQRRLIVHKTIEAHAALRTWKMHAWNVRTNHVHVVTGPLGVEPGAAVGQFKSWCTRRLREAGLAGEKERLWTRRSSTRYLWQSEDVHRAVLYVRDGQGEDLLPRAIESDG